MADLKINGVTPSGVYYGSTAASAVYYGSVKVWSSAPPQTFTVIGGKTYPTVTLPDGHEWLALNLDYAWTGLSVPTSSASLKTSPQAVYYDYDETTYGWEGLQRGLLYNYYAVSYLETNKATLCPGWHVPTIDEYDALVTALGGYSYGYTLKSTTGWADNGNGTDEYGFAGYPSGQFLGSFWKIDTNLYLWSQTATTDAWGKPTDARGKSFSSTSNSISGSSESPKNQNSVRLIKDY